MKGSPLPDDLSNGLIPVLLKNAPLNRLPRAFSLLVATPKPRLVRLAVATAGREAFTTEHKRREAEHFVLKVDIGGVAGWLAPLLGKQPPDSHVWILEGKAPAFVRAEQPFYHGRSALAHRPGGSYMVGRRAAALGRHGAITPLRRLAGRRRAG